MKKLLFLSLIVCTFAAKAQNKKQVSPLSAEAQIKARKQIDSVKNSGYNFITFNNSLLVSRPINTEIWVFVGAFGRGNEILYQSITPHDTCYVNINRVKMNRVISYTCTEAGTKKPLIIVLTEQFDGKAFSIFKGVTVDELITN